MQKHPAGSASPLRRVLSRDQTGEPALANSRRKENVQQRLCPPYQDKSSWDWREASSAERLSKEGPLPSLCYLRRREHVWLRILFGWLNDSKLVAVFEREDLVQIEQVAIKRM